jgi:protein TonB
MLQLFESPATGAIRSSPVQSMLWTIVIHSVVLLFLLTIGLSSAFLGAPDQFNLVQLVVPLPPPAPPPPPLPATGGRVAVKRITREFNAKLIAPVAIPNYAPVAITDTPLDFEVVQGVVGGVPGGVPGGVLNGIVSGLPSMDLPPAPPPPPPPAPVAKEVAPPQTPQRIQVSGSVQEAKLLEMVRPDYPPTAKTARIEGAVRLSAIIDADGNIADLRVVEGHPLLAPAARAAVQRWRYRPTVLNGKAVEVATEIVVNFRLL